MNSGKLEKPAIQGWVANRFYYQSAIPMKDAAVMANCADRETRRKWINRVSDHDGSAGDEGGIEAWIRLGEAVGLSRQELCSFQHVLPGVKFAVDAYVHFARRVTWQEAACSSLTELLRLKFTKKGSRAGPRTILGSRPRVTIIFGGACPKPRATWSMASKSRSHLLRAAPSKSTPSISCNSSSISYGACSTRCGSLTSLKSRRIGMFRRLDPVAQRWHTTKFRSSKGFLLRLATPIQIGS